MIASAAAILVASLLGSVHCAAMCGAFSCFYAGAAVPGARMGRSHALYHAGRLLAYVGLGATAGFIGGSVTGLGAIAGVAHAATIGAGLLMIGWGVTTLASIAGWRGARASAPAGWSRMLAKTLGYVRDQPPATRAFVTGLTTSLMPCGWLYVFVAAAGGAGSVRDGALLMMVFWAGTVPALLAVALGAQRFAGRFRQRLPALSAATVTIIGLLAVSGRLVMSAGSMTHGH